MAGFFLSNLSAVHIGQREPLLRRGSNEVRQNIGGISLIHTGREEQRTLESLPDNVCLLDGSLYGAASSATDLLSMYKTGGAQEFKGLDGDYAFCLLDTSGHKLIFSCDVFGTKPLWYAVGEQWAVASYVGILKRAGLKEVRKALPNTLYIYDLGTHTLESKVIYEFSTRQYKEDFTDWIAAFRRAVEKRIPEQGVPAMGLSSGYDSGAIYCALIEQQVQFIAYIFPARENKEILKHRSRLSMSCRELAVSRQQFLLELHKLVRCCEPYYEDGYDIFSDESCVGLSIMCQNAVTEHAMYMLSGLGADEIIADYGFEGEKFNGLSQFGGQFCENLLHIFPWQNFFGGSQKAYLAKEEYISGLFGVEMRYPFLDRNVVQEFLNLSCDLKNRWYKAPIHAYFMSGNFPFANEKIGFFVRQEGS